jgi:hypothetical protein
MGTTAFNKIIRVTAAAVTGLIALSAYAGTVGLLGGGISFGETIDARLPYGSPILAGLALSAMVAVPMTIAAVAAAKDTHHSPDLVFAAGLLLVVWIGSSSRSSRPTPGSTRPTWQPRSPSWGWLG